MFPNSFQGLVNELDNTSFSANNLVNTAKKYKEKISQVPKSIMHYMSSDKKNGMYVAIAGAMTMIGSTFSAIAITAMGIDKNPYYIAVPFAAGLALYVSGLNEERKYAHSGYEEMKREM